MVKLFSFFICFVWVLEEKKLQIMIKLRKPCIAIVWAVFETFGPGAIQEIFVPHKKPRPIGIVSILNVAERSLFREVVYILVLCIVEYAEVKAPVQIIQ